MNSREILGALHPARWYPGAFVATYVLLAFSATPNPLFALGRPLLLGFVAAAGIQLLLWAILRSHDRAALAAAIMVLGLLATWVPLMVVVTGGTWLVLVSWLRRRSGQGGLWSVARLSPIIAIFAWSLAAVAAVPVAISAATNITDGAQQTPLGDAVRSDVVILLLDGYPRRDSQMEQFAVDSGGFEAALEERGFDIAHAARSNYTSTWMTLTSMVHGRLVEEIDGLAETPASKADHYRLLMHAIAEAPLFADLHEVGYEIVAIPPPIESAALTGADRVLTSGHLTSFELSLLQHSLIGLGILEVAPEIAFDQHRAGLGSSIELAIAEVQKSSDHARLTFVHLLTPHAPIVYGPGGQSAEPSACFPHCSLYVMNGDSDWRRYADQLSSVNRMVLDALDRIRAASDDATIIVMSDHGSARTGADRANLFRSFFAASVPDGSIVFPEDISPVDVLRILADPDANPTTLYRAWISAPEEPMTVAPFDAARP